MIRHTFTFSASAIKEVTVVDKSIKNFTVVIDARDKTSKPYTVSKNNITMLNEPDEFQVTALEDIKDVTIVGPKASIDA